MPEPRSLPPGYAAPDHAWNGDDEGHNCADCPDLSIWRCDRPAHPVAPNIRPSEALKRRLSDAARGRRRIPIPNRNLP